MKRDPLTCHVSLDCCLPSYLLQVALEAEMENFCEYLCLYQLFIVILLRWHNVYHHVQIV